MLRRPLSHVSPWPRRPLCLFCAAQCHPQPPQFRSFGATGARLQRPARAVKVRRPSRKPQEEPTVRRCLSRKPLKDDPVSPVRKTLTRRKEGPATTRRPSKGSDDPPAPVPHDDQEHDGEVDGAVEVRLTQSRVRKRKARETAPPQSLKDAMLSGKSGEPREQLAISILFPQDLEFEPVDHDIPPVPMLSYGLDRVLFNSGIYRLQDERSRVYNFDPYLEKIMPVNEFDFDALSEYKTSSKDEELLALTRRLGSKFTGSTSSMSGILQHFHFVLSNFRKLNHEMLSREFPEPSGRFSKITLGPSAVFLRYKDGVYAIDADKSYDSPNIMSWLGHSLEKLLTTERSEFERFRRSSPDKAPAEDNSSRCYHYSKQGNILMRSQLDAVDPRLPGTGVFDLKTRAVVSIRMNHKEYEEGAGYQLRKARGQWESFEREFYDMTRATLLKYSLQVRMGRMDGIFIAFHNIERIFGFQYLSLSDMDIVLHGQHDTQLGDQEFKLSIALVDELLSRATAQFPNTSLRLHFEARDTSTPFMYVFAEPVTEEVADQIQTTGEAAQKDFARTVVGVGKDDPEVQAAWQNIQDEVDEQVDEDENAAPTSEAQFEQTETQQDEGLNGNEDPAEDPSSQETGTGTMDILAPEPALDASSLEIATDTVDTAAPESASDDISPETATGTMDILAPEPASDAGSPETPTGTLDTPAPEAASDASEDEIATDTVGTSASEPASGGPLMGWTLTVRSKVNEGYVNRPEKLDKGDDWKIEYHIQDIPQGTRWKLYDALKERRRKLIGLDEEKVAETLKPYRDLIQRYSDRGRKWRKEQDEMDEGKGVQLFRPLGPGSDNVDSVTKETNKEE